MMNLFIFLHPKKIATRLLLNLELFVMMDDLHLPPLHD